MTRMSFHGACHSGFGSIMFSRRTRDVGGLLAEEVVEPGAPLGVGWPLRRVRAVLVVEEGFDGAASRSLLVVEEERWDLEDLAESRGFFCCCAREGGKV